MQRTRYKSYRLWVEEPNEKLQFVLVPWRLTVGWVTAAPAPIYWLRKALWWWLGMSQISEYSEISLGIIWLIFLTSWVWFYLRSLGYCVSGSQTSKRYLVWALSYGMGPKLNQSLVGHSHKFCATIAKEILAVGHIVGRRFCGYIGLPVAPLGGLLWYRRLLLHVSYPPVLEVLTSISLIDSWKFLLN